MTQEDPYLWLEDVDGEPALKWVREQSARAEAQLEDADFPALEARLHAALTSSARLALPAKHGEHLYNFWQDAEHPKGVWRRCTLEQYRADPVAWETVLDLDALAAREGESWVWQGEEWLEPFDGRVLVYLSRGGGRRERGAGVRRAREDVRRERFCAARI